MDGGGRAGGGVGGRGGEDDSEPRGTGECSGSSLNVSWVADATRLCSRSGRL